MGKDGHNKVGRPSKYETIDLSRIKLLASKGWTDTEMAEFFDVDPATWHRWKGKHEEFRESLKDWKDESDRRVERSLYERALGYSHIETKFATHEGEITDSQEYIKHYAPDTTAAIFWLKNRKPAEWRDKREHELSTEGNKPLKWEVEIVRPEDVEGD